MHQNPGFANEICAVVGDGEVIGGVLAGGLCDGDDFGGLAIRRCDVHACAQAVRRYPAQRGNPVLHHL